MAGGRIFITGLVTAMLAACGNGQGANAGAPPPGSEGVTAVSEAEPDIQTVASGLDHPWALTFLPDGRMLVTERPGRLRIVNAEGQLSSPIQGVPEVAARGQGGLLDVTLDPQFAQNSLVYLSYAEAGDGGAGTAVARGRLEGERLNDVEVIFRQTPKTSGPNHFGSRLVFSGDGKLFIALGERFEFAPAQDNSNTLGTVVRVDPDGGVPPDNPFVGQADARPEIWSYGHRNIQSAALHPETGDLWVVEMGPMGGDELNIAEAGGNYGWPLVSWGNHYDGRPIPDPPTRPDLADAILTWTPAIAPSGMVFYAGDLFPAWRGDILVGGLVSEALIRVRVEGDRAVEDGRISIGRRVRDVAVGPDGAVYLVTDHSDGEILRLTPR